MQKRFPSLVKTRETDINEMPGIVSAVDPTADTDLREMVEAVVKEMKVLDQQEGVQTEQKESQLRSIFRKAFPFSQSASASESSSAEGSSSSP